MKDKNIKPLNYVKVSIIVPVYNVEKYIERCIQSAMNQTLNEIEIIIIDDGSTDNTLQMIKTLSTKDDRVVILEQKNGGVSAARNAGLNISRGEYITFLDGDDWVESNACEKQYEFAKKEKLDMVITDFYRDYDNGNIELIKDLKNKNVFYTPKEYLAKLFRGKSNGVVWNKLYDRSLFKERCFPEHSGMGEDYVMNALVATNAKRIGKLHEPYYHYISNPNSITRNMTPEKILQLFDNLDFVIEKYGSYGVLSIYEEDIRRSQLLRVYAFLKDKPFFGDVHYEAGIERVLKFFESKPKVYNDLGLSRRVKVLYLKWFPSRKNIVRMIEFNNKRY